MTAVPRYALCILGMHRSGTSALAGTLARFGADAPATMMKTTEDNAAGYYESTPIMLLNEKLLKSAGTSWDDWTRIPEGWFAGPRAAAMKAEAREVLEKEFGASPLFVLKDPRICRLWPFWRDVLADMGVTPVPILMLRPAEEVAQSLFRRDKLPLAMGRLIWLRHQLDADAATRDAPRVVTSYDQLLTDWRPMVAEVERVAGFALPRRSRTTDDEVDAFLKPELRRFTAAGLDGAVPADVYVEAQDLLMDRTRTDTARLEAIHQWLESFGALIHDVASPIRIIAKEAAGLGREIAKRDREIAGLRIEQEELSDVAEDKTALLHEAIAQRDAILRQTAESEAEAARKHAAEVERLQREMARLAEAAVKREELLAERHRDELRKERQKALDEVYRSRSWRLTKPVRWISRVARGRA